MRLTVLISIPLSMYTTSSVATFPEAPGAYGHPPKPPMDESITDMPIYLKIKSTISYTALACKAIKMFAKA